MSIPAGFPGALTLVARRGATVWCDCVGQRDLERDLPWTRDTLVRIYSMTKPITATALMMLFEQGLCHLDDPVDLYIPEFADRTVLRPDAGSVDDVEPARTRLTLHHLLTHTSGLTYGFQDGLLAEAYRRDGVDFDHHGATLAETAARLARLPLGFEPGSRWHYSVSTDVVGRIVEVISGRPLDRVFREEILGPLGMADTFFAVPEGKLDRLASLLCPAARRGHETLRGWPRRPVPRGRGASVLGRRRAGLDRRRLPPLRRDAAPRRRARRCTPARPAHRGADGLEPPARRSRLDGAEGVGRGLVRRHRLRPRRLGHARSGAGADPRQQGRFRAGAAWPARSTGPTRPRTWW